ncbi:meiosis-specific protein MEI4 [Denticeps clupeoides]|uniref:meiosis-specific protein MEI4 n=1 Tax=Denticeps clupeoides TaxID=299321 RepID=UPI0010A39412|nr:meiosis-specific protein MEI4 [Denticeps clupeoides]
MDTGAGGHSSQAARAGQWSAASAKLAVAVAVIKSRPPGRSGRQHAEDLAAGLGRRDESWEAKARGLQREVLRLRQELLLSRTRSRPAGNDPATLLSQEFSDSPKVPQLSEVVPATPENDSGHGSGSNTEALLQTAGADEADGHPPATASLRPRFPGGASDPMAAHMQFLQNLCGLRKLDACWHPLAEEGSVAWDSAGQLLRSLVSAYKDGRTPTQQALLLQASQVAAQALDQCRPCSGPSRLFITHAEDCLKELAEHLLSNSHLNRFTSQEGLADCLILLGRSRMLRRPLLDLLLSQINLLADHLWNACQEGTGTFEVERYENSFYVYWVLEQLLKDGPRYEHREAQGQLERQVIRLSDEFPLFALYMWRIGGLLNPTVLTETLDPAT